ncbi:hypothetical protein F5B21DRAFT_479111 [Xylaria acuta]|nr:hypothetical protein F5B21DRAFT_479111 [Xylaria acuta]
MVSRMSAARQFIIALETLYQAEVVHRNLDEGAVIWEITDTDKYDRATQYRHFGRHTKRGNRSISCGQWGFL